MKKNLNFELEIRVNVKTEYDVKEFLAALNQSTGCSFNIKRGKPDLRQSGRKTLSQVRGYMKHCMNVVKSIRI